MLASAVSSIRLSEQSMNAFTDTETLSGTISLTSPASLKIAMDILPEEGNCACRRSILWSPSKVMYLFRLLILLGRSLQSPRRAMLIDLSLKFGGCFCDSLMGYAFTDISGSWYSLLGYTAVEQFVVGTVVCEEAKLRIVASGSLASHVEVARGATVSPVVSSGKNLLAFRVIGLFSLCGSLFL